MTKIKPLYIGNNETNYSEKQTSGKFAMIDGEEFYTIDNVQNMEPFLMHIASDTDHWMFISSNGSLTAGRKKPEYALFPYYPVDKIHDSSEITGSKTIIRVSDNGKTFLWEPFSFRYNGIYNITRSISKNICSSKIIFKETNQDLNLEFTYQWCNSEKYGFSRKSSITNLSSNAINIELLDGIQNILPFGINRMMQLDKSPLIDAYKKCELVKETGLGIFSLSSIPIDKPEPSESLQANIVWYFGKDINKILLSSNQLDKFRKGFEVEEELEIKGKRGAYFINNSFELSGNETQNWYLIADVGQTSSKIATIQKLLTSNKNLTEIVEEDISRGTKNLKKLVASADGLQLSNDQRASFKQFSSVMFNAMRGGIFDDNYNIIKTDFIEFVKQANRLIWQEKINWLNNLPESINYLSLIEKAEVESDAMLYRLSLEYLPITFSRRHGDPSRPWNLFSIETKNENGSKIFNYQGNWRDIFQNWEALSLSYPGFVESMICKFINASSADGYNPYRLTREGFEWEIHNSEDPWSFIGYWGDHQVIYLLKLLEISNNYHPEKLFEFLQKNIFSYSNIPYRIKDHMSILHDPHHSIIYDQELENIIAMKVNDIGADGKSVLNKSGKVYLVNLTEKLLVSLLTKLSNYVPEGGMWMNTQRPEWNDANNALAGYGLSMVTLSYLRRYFSFCLELFKECKIEKIKISEEVAVFFNEILSIYKKYEPFISKSLDAETRFNFITDTGKVATEYRTKIYSGFSEKQVSISVSEIQQLFTSVIRHFDHSIACNKRDDGLYHAYNLMEFDGINKVEISYLQEMLEGQVAVLSSGFLKAKDSLEVLEALRKSAIYREAQKSYMLYPDKNLPSFIEKNNIPTEFIEKSGLLKLLLKKENKQIIEKDTYGNCHFNCSFTNKNVLCEALKKLPGNEFESLLKKEMQSIVNIYEEIFNHKTFTGRSGSFYGYEGLGCIYWHMVSKLLLAIGETITMAIANNEDKNTISELGEKYYEVQSGLGINKTPMEYGAFPVDPYSHTPGHSGAQQPGMTGQVKEDIISRFNELGLHIKNGKICFLPYLIRENEFLSEPEDFNYYDNNGNEKTIRIEKGSMVFTFCQVPIVLKDRDTNRIEIQLKVEKITFDKLEINENISKKIFERTGEVDRIEVSLLIPKK